MQYENIPTVRLLIIAEIYGLTDAELRRSVQICNLALPLFPPSPRFVAWSFLLRQQANGRIGRRQDR